MDLDQLMRPVIDATKTPPAFAGRVTRLDAEGNAYATIPALSTEFEHGPLRLSTGATAPAVGTECLVVFDEENHPWVATGTPGPAGADGAAGATGPQGPTGYDTAPIGSTIAWTRQSIPWDYVLANGQRLARADYPDAWNVAVAEADAGNTLWSYRTSDQTFTVPNLSDRFIYSAGAKALGTTGGEETHVLTAAEMPAHTHGPPSGTPFLLGNGISGGFGVAGSGNGGINVSATSSAGGGGAHNNMPPYVVLGRLVKVRGVSADATVIQGPTGPQGPAGPTGPTGLTGATGPTGPGLPSGVNVYGPYTVAAGSVSVAAQAEASVRYTHNLGLPDASKVVVVGHLFDGSFGNRATWRAVPASNYVDFVLYNPSPSGGSTALPGIKFFLYVGA